jgi:hypothetical protein
LQLPLSASPAGAWRGLLGPAYGLVVVVDARRFRSGLLRRVLGVVAVVVVWLSGCCGRALRGVGGAMGPKGEDGALVVVVMGWNAAVGEGVSWVGLFEFGG